MAYLLALIMLVLAQASFCADEIQQPYIDWEKQESSSTAAQEQPVQPIQQSPEPAVQQEKPVELAPKASEPAVQPVQAEPPPIALSEEEKKWLAGHKTISIAYDGSLPPYSFVNDKGKIDGVAVEIINILGNRLGITFNIYPDYNWASLYKAAAKRNVDVVATMVDRSDRGGWFAFTKPYLTKSLVIVTKHDNSAINKREDIEGKKVAVVKGYQYSDQIVNEFPTIKLRKVDTMLSGLQIVESGQADAAIIFLGTVNYLQAKYGLNNLRIAAFYDRNNANESIAVRKDWPILVQVLQKGLDSLTEHEVQQIFAKWVVGSGLPTGQAEIKPPPSPVPPVAPEKPPVVLPTVTEQPLIRAQESKPATLPSGNLLVLLAVVAAPLLVWLALKLKRANVKPTVKHEIKDPVRNLQSDHNDDMHLTIDTDDILNEDHAPVEIKAHPTRVLPLSEDISYHQDAEGKMTYVSANVTSLLGYSENDFMMHYRDYLTKNPLNSTINEQIEKRIQGKSLEPYELEIYDTDKDVHWFEITDTPIYSGQGHCIGVDGIMRDVTAQKLYEKVSVKSSAVEHSEIPDAMQDLHTQIKDSIHSAALSQQIFVLIYLTLDRLRSLDGELYYADKVEVLEESTKRLKATLRDTDKVIQFDANKFALILPDTDTDMVGLVIEKIRKILQVPYLIGVHSVVLDVEIGLAIYPKDGSEPASLINAAQILLPAHEIKYTAMATHGQSIDPNNDGEVLDLQQALLAALDECKLSLRASSKQNINALQRHSQLSIYYQSRHNINDYSIVGFETLVRWRHPHKGLLLPLDFVPLIRGIGLLDIMTYWILQQVCFQAVLWESQGIRPALLTINLSGIGLKKTLEASKILSIIHEAGAKPEWLAFSIPENEIAKQLDAVLPLIKELTEAGVVFAVDNFGADSHFLPLLESIPAKIIEIDPIYLRDVTDSYTNPETILQTIAMLKAQDRIVILKEVETEAQLDFLKNTGCDMVQGYLLSRAVPASEAKELMETFPDVAWYFQQK